MTESSTGGPRAVTRARAAGLLFGGLAAATDLLPPRVRYGYVHRVTRAAFQRPLPDLPSEPSTGPASEVVVTARPDDLVCALVAGDLDVGGIGSVVETLAGSLPTAGIRPVVVCTDDGRRAARLRQHGVQVEVVGSVRSVAAAVTELAPQVIELHGAPTDIEAAVAGTGIPLVPVMHNTEIHFTTSRWQHVRWILSQASSAIAVSEVVRGFHAAHLPLELADKIEVVANAVPGPAARPDREERSEARDRVSRVWGQDLGDDVLLVTLARYDSQKNIAGTVASFLRSVDDSRVRLLIAGEPSDWVELNRAAAVIGRRRAGRRVALLGTSDPRTLLTAADGFLLNSFFEGWPVAATEAAAMGLPLILSDVGGARELVARDPQHSMLVPNPCGSSDHISDGAVTRARRRSNRQPNAKELGSAVAELASRVRSADHPSPARPEELLAAMTRGHAEVLRAATRHVPVNGSKGAGR